MIEPEQGDQGTRHKGQGRYATWVVCCATCGGSWALSAWLLSHWNDPIGSSFQYTIGAIALILVGLHRLGPALFGLALLIGAFAPFGHGDSTRAGSVLLLLAVGIAWGLMLCLAYITAALVIPLLWLPAGLFALFGVVYSAVVRARRSGVIRNELAKSKRLKALARSECPSCGYDLAGLRGEVCPECGNPTECKT